jgi:HAD superfamily hydrolase (TIGR01509 family)
MKTTSPDLVIFDCDGVLVDSEPISVGVLIDIVAGLGVQISEDSAYDKFLGKSMATISGLLRTDFGLAITDGDLDRMRAAVYSRFERELKPIPGIQETVLKLNGARCVASSSQPERIRLSLRVTGLLELFEPHIYSSTMVTRGKPAPDLFLHAAKEMGVAPSDCVVIEDSAAGVEAAKKAGMHVLAFAGGSHAATPGLRAAIAALEPDAVFHDMSLLPDLLAGWRKQPS